MKDEITVYRQECKCGHDRASHYKEYRDHYDASGNQQRTTIIGACLCRGCTCTRYQGP